MGNLDYLGRAWINAEAATPHDWRLVGVVRRDRAVRLLRETDPNAPDWCALAEDETGILLDAWGDAPADALNSLARAMRIAGGGQLR